MMAARSLPLVRTAGNLAIGGSPVRRIGLSMPYLMASLAFVATFTIFRSLKGARESRFPPLLRTTSVAVFGTMIGATFTTDHLAVVPSLGPALMAMQPANTPDRWLSRPVPVEFMAVPHGSSRGGGPRTLP